MKNVVAYYNNVLNRIVEESGGLYARSSVGRVESLFEPSLEKSFNRGFTSYFLKSARPAASMASIYTPKSQGERVGVVKSVGRGCIRASLDCGLTNGDGLAFFDKNGVFTGFRLNRVDGDVLYPALPVSPEPGAVLYRNSDKAFDDVLSRESSVRLVGVDMTLRLVADGVALDVSDERGCGATAVVRGIPVEEARSSQADARRAALSKLGATVYRVRTVDDRCGSVFIPVSVLTGLRRRAVEMLDSDNAVRYRRELRRDELSDAVWPGSPDLTYHDNVANALSREFYLSHGVGKVGRALEVDPSSGHGPLVVMTTRYCLRNELGACLKGKNAGKLKGPLSIKSGALSFGLEFDCKKCVMKVVRKR